MLQLWGGVVLIGIVAVVAVEHRYFGLPVGVAMFIENLLAWVPLSLLVGALIGKWVARHALAWSFYTFCVAFGWLLWGALRMDRQSPESGATGIWEMFIYLAGTSGIYLLVATLAGTYLVSRAKRASELG